MLATFIAWMAPNMIPAGNSFAAGAGYTSLGSIGQASGAAGRPSGQLVGSQYNVLFPPGSPSATGTFGSATMSFYNAILITYK